MKLFEPKTDESPDSGLDRERLLADAHAFAHGPVRGDEVEEASMESFPASDAPSFTPTTSVGRKKSRPEEREDRRDDSR